MGIIIKQSIRGSVWSYIGVVIGFVTTSYLYPKFLTPDVVGLFGLLVAYSTLFGQFSLLGVHGVTARLFPYFRDKESGHHGFLFIPFLFMVVGFSIFLIAYFFFSPYLIESNQEKSKLFANYTYLLIPLTFFTMVYFLLDTYNKVLYDAVFGTFLQEFLQRVLVFAVVIFYIFHFLSLQSLIIAYATIICFKGVSMILFLYYKGEIQLRPQLYWMDKKLKKEIVNVALYFILGGLGSMIVFNIDKIVINQMLDLSNTGVYTIAFYFGTLVVIPSRPLLKISGTLIADAWRENDIKKIKEIYYKSCINQFIIGGFLFLEIWANIGNILTILGPDYQQSKWVIFFIGLGYLFDMMTGVNSLVIGYSKYYKIGLVFITTLIIVVVSLLYTLIPIWGIIGAAIAIAAALLLNNIMRYLFLLWKYKLQPFNSKFIIVALFYTGVYFLTLIIPQEPLIWDIIIRGSLITILTICFLILFPVSMDIHNIIEISRNKILGCIKKQ